MQLARVIGTLVATRKDEKLEGLKFLIVRPVNSDGQDIASPVVAVDAVGAGVGEMVMIATGSSARQTVLTDRRPCDADDACGLPAHVPDILFLETDSYSFFSD